MREHWHDCEPDGLDEPAAASLRAFPAPGRPARLHSQPASGLWTAGDEQRSGEQGLRWPPAESWWPGPGYGEAAGSHRAWRWCRGQSGQRQQGNRWACRWQ